jgi:hypothetical protein
MAEVAASAFRSITLSIRRESKSARGGPSSSGGENWKILLVLAALLVLGRALLSIFFG